MPIYVSPGGNPEVWNSCPEGYVPPETWQAAHPLPRPELPALEEIRAVKVAAVNAGFYVAMAASLTMPSVGTPPSPIEVASALYDWRTEDPEGYADLLAIHSARRDELLSAVAAATTVEAVQAVTVSYAV